MKTMIIFLLLVLVLPVYELFAVKVKHIEVKTFDDFQKGSFEGTGIDSLGNVFLGYKINTFAGPAQEYYLSMGVSGKSNDVYIGCGHLASIFKINPDTNDISEIYQSNFMDIFALEVSAKDEIVFGTSPNGKVFRIVADKKAEEVFDPEEKYIWDIKLAANGDIICAVGNPGGVYRISGQGSAQKILSAEDNHIVRLFIRKDNSILAGSGDRGLIYKIENSKTKVLYNSPLEEIKGICEDADGNVYFSASKRTHNQLMDLQDQKSDLKDVREKNKLQSPKRSIVYCLDNSGIVEEIWDSADEYIYSMSANNTEKSILIGTGNNGRIYQINKDGYYTIVYESPAAQIFNLLGIGNKTYFCTNNSTGLGFIDNESELSASYLTEIFDMKTAASVGRLYWYGQPMDANTIQFFVRSGNSSVPDNTWSNWSAPFSDPQNTNLNLQNVRFFQLKVNLNAPKNQEKPKLNYIKVFYLQSNIKPEIKTIDIRFVEMKQEAEKKIDAVMNSKKLIFIKWNVFDANEDPLKFQLFLKNANGQDWILLEKDWQKETFIIDPELYADGSYVFKIIADDALGNPQQLFKENSKVSMPFVIDSTPPVIKDIQIMQNKISFIASDLTSNISEVKYSLDRKIWYPLFPEDKICDSKEEKFSFTLETIKQFSVIYLKVTDEAGNINVFQQKP